MGRFFFLLVINTIMIDRWKLKHAQTSAIATMPWKYFSPNYSIFHSVFHDDHNGFAEQEPWTMLTECMGTGSHNGSTRHYLMKRLQQ